MDSDTDSVLRFLDFVDRRSLFMELAVQQFKEHTQKCRESLRANAKLVDMPPPACQEPRAQPHAVPDSVAMEARRVAPRTRRRLGDPVPEAENVDPAGGKRYMLRPRANRKPPTTAAPERVLRSRAKQAVVRTQETCGPLNGFHQEAQGQFTEAEVTTDKENRQTSLAKSSKTAATAAKAGFPLKERDGNRNTNDEPKAPNKLRSCASEIENANGPFSPEQTPYVQRRRQNGKRKQPLSRDKGSPILEQGDGRGSPDFPVAKLSCEASASPIRTSAAQIVNEPVASGRPLQEHYGQPSCEAVGRSRAGVTCPTKGGEGSPPHGPAAANHSPQQLASDVHIPGRHEFAQHLQSDEKKSSLSTGIRGVDPPVEIDTTGSNCKNQPLSWLKEEYLPTGINPGLIHDYSAGNIKLEQACMQDCEGKLVPKLASDLTKADSTDNSSVRNAPRDLASRNSCELETFKFSTDAKTVSLELRKRLGSILFGHSKAKDAHSSTENFDEEGDNIDGLLRSSKGHSCRVTEDQSPGHTPMSREELGKENGSVIRNDKDQGSAAVGLTVIEDSISPVTTKVSCLMSSILLNHRAKGGGYDSPTGRRSFGAVQEASYRDCLGMECSFENNAEATFHTKEKTLGHTNTMGNLHRETANCDAVFIPSTLLNDRAKGGGYDSPTCRCSFGAVQKAHYSDCLGMEHSFQKTAEVRFHTKEKTPGQTNSVDNLHRETAKCDTVLVPCKGQCDTIVEPLQGEKTLVLRREDPAQLMSSIKSSDYCEMTAPQLLHPRELLFEAMNDFEGTDGGEPLFESTEGSEMYSSAQKQKTAKHSLIPSPRVFEPHMGLSTKDELTFPNKAAVLTTEGLAVVTQGITAFNELAQPCSGKRGDSEVTKLAASGSTGVKTFQAIPEFVRDGEPLFEANCDFEVTEVGEMHSSAETQRTAKGPLISSPLLIEPHMGLSANNELTFPNKGTILTPEGLTVVMPGITPITAFSELTQLRRKASGAFCSGKGGDSEVSKVASSSTGVKTSRAIPEVGRDGSPVETERLTGVTPGITPITAFSELTQPQRKASGAICSGKGGDSEVSKVVASSSTGVKTSQAIPEVGRDGSPVETRKIESLYMDNGEHGEEPELAFSTLRYTRRTLNKCGSGKLCTTALCFSTLSKPQTKFGSPIRSRKTAVGSLQNTTISGSEALDLSEPDTGDLPLLVEDLCKEQGTLYKDFVDSETVEGCEPTKLSPKMAFNVEAKASASTFKSVKAPLLSIVEAVPRSENLHIKRELSYVGRRRQSVSLEDYMARHSDFSTKQKDEMSVKVRDSIREDITLIAVPSLHCQDDKAEMHCLDLDVNNGCNHTDSSPALSGECESKKMHIQAECLGLHSSSMVCTSCVEPIHNTETQERTLHEFVEHCGTSNGSIQMDCSVSPSPPICKFGEGDECDMQKNKEGLEKSQRKQSTPFCGIAVPMAESSEQIMNVIRSKETLLAQNFTPEGSYPARASIQVDEKDVFRFNQLMSQGTVNSSRRKRVRSPHTDGDQSVGLYKVFKKMKLSIDKTLNQKVVEHAHEYPVLLSLSRPCGEEDSPSNRISHPFSQLRSSSLKSQDTLNSFQDKYYKDGLGFDVTFTSQKQSTDSEETWNSSSGATRKDLHTPFSRSRCSNVNNGNCTRAKEQEFASNLDTETEDDVKENKNASTSLADIRTAFMLERLQNSKLKKVMGHANEAKGTSDSCHKRYNLAVNTSSFLDLVQPKPAPMPLLNGKREVRVKALEAAELARRQEEKREHDRKMRKFEYNEGKDVEYESLQKDKLPVNSTTNAPVKGKFDKVKHVVELKSKMDQEKAKRQEEEQRRKDEEWKKKEADFAQRKRKREDAEKREREEKRKRVEEVQRLRKEQEERQRLELNEKEQKRKAMEERERERKAQEEEAKRQRRIEKEREAERRRKREQEGKAAILAEKEAERRRKEALLQARGHEDDQTAQHARGKQLSEIAAGLRASADWEPHVTSYVEGMHLRHQTSEEVFAAVPGVLPLIARLGSLAHNQINGIQTSTSALAFGVNSKLSAGRVFQADAKQCEIPKGFRSHTPAPFGARVTPYGSAHLTNLETGIQSYEISPYRSSSDEEDDHDKDKPKKPIPFWARAVNLMPHLARQQFVDPDEIFSSKTTCSLTEIFATTGSRRRQDFNKRSGTGDWLEDHASWKEEVEYKIQMGYIQQ